MKAILVTVSVTTRVIVPDNFSIDNPTVEDDNILKSLAAPRLTRTLNDDFFDNIDVIMDDEECPFGSLKQDEQYKN
jgi:hypothetical protein